VHAGTHPSIHPFIVDDVHSMLEALIGYLQQTRGRFGASKRMVNLCEFQEMVSYSELQQMLASGKRLHQCPWLPQTHELFGQRFQHTVRELWTLHGTYENEAFSLLPPELMFHLCELLCTLSLAPPATANAAATTSTSTSTSTAS